MNRWRCATVHESDGRLFEMCADVEASSYEAAALSFASYYDSLTRTLSQEALRVYVAPISFW